MIELFHSAQPLVNRKKVESHYGAVFVLQTQIVNMKGEKGSQAVDVFYQPKPDTEKGHGPYFCMYPDYDTGHSFIAGFPCVLAATGIVIENVFAYSAHRRDYVVHPKNKAAFIDGGREYTRGSPEFPHNAYLILDPEGPKMMVKCPNGWFVLHETKWGAPDEE